MERKLKGINKENLWLSVHGQVHQLIQEATSETNLSTMFVGWMAFI